MTILLSVKIDEQEVRTLCKEKIEELVKASDLELVFWDADELKRRTCMSWNFIQSAFFFAPGFPKKKVGSKWYFPARETRAFLEKWLMEQP